MIKKLTYIFNNISIILCILSILIHIYFYINNERNNFFYLFLLGFIFIFLYII